MRSLRYCCYIALFAATSLLCNLTVSGQTPDQMANDPERKEAFDLYRQNKARRKLRRFWKKW